MRSTIAPPKDDPPLSVHSNAVLADPRASECFESISRRNAEVVQSRRMVEIAELAERRALNPRIDPLDPFKSKQGLSVAIRKRCDHRAIVTDLVIVVKRIGE